MTRQVTDQLYIELDYFTPEEYYVYIAEAVANTQSSSTMTADVGVIKSSGSQMTVETSVSATISHIEGADLFAFSEAAIAVAVDRIRDYNIDSQAQFDIATDGSVIKDIQAAGISLFDIATQAERSRDYESAVEAAFSFDCDYDVLKLPIEAAADLTAISALASLGDRIRFADSSLSAEASLTGIISNIRGIDLVSLSFASLSADVSVLFESSADLSSQFQQTSLVGKLKTFDDSLNLQTGTFLAAYPDVLVRPFALETRSGGRYDSYVINNLETQFGNGSLDYQDNTNVYPIADNAVWTGTEFVIVAQGLTWKSTDGETWTRSNNNLPSGAITSSTVNQLAFGGNVFAFFRETSVTFASDPTLTLYYSSDAVTWTTLTRQASEFLGNWTSSSRLVPFSLKFISGQWTLIGSSIFSNAHRFIIWRSASISGIFSRTGNFFRFNVTSSVFGTSNHNVQSLRSSGANEIKVSELHIAAGSSTANINIFTVNASSVVSSGATFGPGISINLPTSDGVGDVHVSDDGVQRVVRFFFSGEIVYRRSTNSGSSYSNFTLPNGTAPSAVHYVNSRWFLFGGNQLYTGTSVTNLSLVTSRIDTSQFSTLLFGNSRWLIAPASANTALKDVGKSFVSTNGVNFTEHDIANVSGLPGSLTYQLTNSNFGTLDFWIYPGGNGRIFFSNRQQFSINAISNVFQNDIRLFSNNNFLTPNIALTAGQWNHIRLSRQSSLSLYLNGTRVWNGSVSGLDQGALTLVSSLKIDELLLTDSVLTNTSQTTLSVPTEPWTNDSNTKLLLHFDKDLNDDALIPVIPSAVLAATSNLTSQLTGIQGIIALLEAQTSLTAFAVKQGEIILSAFSDAELSTEVSVIRSAEIDAFSLTQQQTDVLVLRGFAADLAGQFVQTASAIINVFGSADLASEFGFEIDYAGSTIGAAALLASLGEMSVTGTRIQQAESDLTGQFDIVVDAIKAVPGEATLNVVSTLTAIGVKDTDIILEAFGQAELTTAIEVLRSAEAELDCITQIETIAQTTLDGSADLSISTDLVNSITVDYSVSLELASQFDSDIQVGIVHLDQHVYRIPSELRSFIIGREDRIFSIFPESRTFTIRR